MLAMELTPQGTCGLQLLTAGTDVLGQAAGSHGNYPYPALALSLITLHLC